MSILENPEQEYRCCDILFTYYHNIIPIRVIIPSLYNK